MLKGSHIFEIGDHGALIVAAPDQEATTSVYYTWNEGLTWETVQVSSTPIHITNIVIEPTNTAVHFIVYGRTATSAKERFRDSKGVVISLDFSSLHERVCQLPDKPGDPSSDYETWSPNGVISEHCLMGHQTTYVRRKREAECFNPEEWENWVDWKDCECTEEDWECDLGYERKHGDGPCLPTSNDTVSFEPPEDCDIYYYVTQGYRKVAGNTCVGGVNYDPIQLPCPGKGWLKSALIFLLALAAIVAGAHCIYSNTGTVGQGLRAVKGLVVRLIDKIRRKSSKPSLSLSGFRRMTENTVPDSYAEDEDEGQFNFDDQRGSAGEGSYGFREQGGKKMSGRGGLDSAQKEIPMISKPRS